MTKSIQNKATKSTKMSAVKSEVKFEQTDKPVDASHTPTGQEQSLLPKIRPKKPLSAFIFFTGSKLQEIGKSNPQSKITERITKCGEIWKLMTDAQKKKYIDLAQADKERHDRECEQLEKQGYFVNSDGVKSTDIKPPLKMFAKDVVMPKKVRSPFCFFVKLNEAKIREANPDLKSFVEISKAKFEAWCKLTEKEKEPYIAMREQDRLRFERERDQLQTQGYFINEKGIKSTDLRVKMTMAQLKERREKLNQIKSKEMEHRQRLKLKVKEEKEREAVKKERLREKKARIRAREVAQREKEKERAIREKEREKAAREKEREKLIKEKERAKALKEKEKASKERLREKASKEKLLKQSPSKD